MKFMHLTLQWSRCFRKGSDTFCAEEGEWTYKRKITSSQYPLFLTWFVSPSNIQVPHDHGCSMYLQHIHAIKGRSRFNFRGISLLYLNFKTWSSAVHLPLLPMGICWYSTSTNGLINAQEIYLILWGQLGVFNR